MASEIEIETEKSQKLKKNTQEVIMSFLLCLRSIILIAKLKERSRSRVCINSKEHEYVMSFRRHIIGPPWVLGIWGEWLFIFRELGSTGNYFQGFGEQAHSFGDLGIPAKK